LETKQPFYEPHPRLVPRTAVGIIASLDIQKRESGDQCGCVKTLFKPCDDNFIFFLDEHPVKQPFYEPHSRLVPRTAVGIIASLDIQKRESGDQRGCVKTLFNPCDDNFIFSWTNIP
jgi:hypothetical protein